MISPNRIVWGDYSSTDYDIITQLAFDSDDETDTFLSREAVASESYNNAFKRTTNYKWSDSFEPTITLIKNDYSEFSYDENRRILSWLTSKQAPSYLSIYADSSNVISFEILGNFTNIQQKKTGNNRVVGYVATFSSLLPYPLSPIKSIEKNIIVPEAFSIKCLTDEYESLVYPKITISHSNNLAVKVDASIGHTFEIGKNAPSTYVKGTVYEYNDMFYWVDQDNKVIGNEQNVSDISTTSVVIINEDLGIRCEVSDNVSNETIVLDGANQIVSSSNPYRIFGDSFNWEWLPLKRGDNQIKVIGNCYIKFEFRYPIKCGQTVG